MNQAKPHREWQTNLCIQVEELDPSAPKGGHAVGTVIAPNYASGQRVAVRLMDAQECADGFQSKRSDRDRANFIKKRPTIEGFTNGYRVGSNNVKPMNIGGLMQFHGCTQDMVNSTDELPVWKAQYAENYGNDEKRAVLYGSGRVTVREHGDKTYAKLELLHIQNATQVKSLDDIATFYANNMTGKAGQLFMADVAMENFGALRLIKDGLTIARPFYSPSIEVETQDASGTAFKMHVPGDALDAMEHAFTKGLQGNGFFMTVAAALDPARMDALPEHQQRQAKEIQRELDAGKMSIEMIPGVKIDIVGDTLNQMLDEKKQLNRQLTQALIKPSVVEGQPTPEPVQGFIRMTVAVSIGNSRAVDQSPGLIVSKFSNDEFAFPYSLGHIPTEMSKSAWAAVREKISAEEAEQAVDRGGVASALPDQPHDVHEADAPNQPSLATAEDYSPQP